MPQASPNIPADYSDRVKSVRASLGLTQTRLAEQLGVAFATVNRWENGQSKPTRLAWQQFLGIEAEFRTSQEEATTLGTTPSQAPILDFVAKPDVVATVAEAHRLAYGHLFNPAFATEISLIDPLPHQRIAVYDNMLGLSPLRFLLADDAGAGKTIMTGLYLREVFARRLIKRVLVVPPAGLVGNWEREMRVLFRLLFKIVRGADARTDNPFVGPDSDRVIVSVDTLAGERMFTRLREAVTSGKALPYDLVVFDEAHKLAANRERDFYVRKTDRYRLAEALAGLPTNDARWELGWSAAHVLLLTATPHMGKDFPYYCLWRLLAPDALATFDAFQDFPESQRRQHFIRRTKEEMVRFDGQPLYPQRQCDTLSYELNPAEQQLYEATTSYITSTYNKARILNSSAARFIVSVFQRRQASSTYALLRSFERRLERLDGAIELVRTGNTEELKRRQDSIKNLSDFFETHTADEDVSDSDQQERHEEFEDKALSSFFTLTLMELQEERAEVETLLAQAKHLADVGEDSKFEKLRAVLQDEAYANEKFIIFTEHRDTAEFLVRRLEGLGFTGQVALIHGGIDYRKRESQVDLFRRSLDEGGANYLVATDAAGEGINLQFCWLMVNYDLPWNPARLEQRMGRIHRYGQKRDPVIIVNLIAGATREGRVLKTLLEKLELIREQLQSDKVFDVIGRLFENVPLTEYFGMAATEDDTSTAIDNINKLLTEEQINALDKREQALYGDGDVKSHLPKINADMEREQYRRLLPGYIRRFVEAAAPLIDLRVNGDSEGIFELSPERSHSLDPVLSAMELYQPEMQRRLTVYRPEDRTNAIWMHPGEPVFDRFCDTLLSRCGDEARRGTFFVDPHAEKPYLFHLAKVSVMRRQPTTATTDPIGDAIGNKDNTHTEIIENRLIGLKQESDGVITTCPLEHLLLLQGAQDVPPGSVSLAGLARKLTDAAIKWCKSDALARLVNEHRARVESTLSGRRDWINRGYDHKSAELVAKRQHVSNEARKGDSHAKVELTKVKEQQQQLKTEKKNHLELLEMEPDFIVPGEVEMLAHAIILPTDDPEEQRRHTAEVEVIAMRLAQAHEEAVGATVHDVSRPDLARVAGLNDWPGFDLRSLRPATSHSLAEERAIEVKGRAGTAGVEISENEWANACNLRERYWLYVVFDCATPRPRLVKVRDPFGRLLAKTKGSMTISSTEILSVADAEDT
ncbi:MAG: helicase-related protein [Gammaproteobacteria bacterium]